MKALQPLDDFDTILGQILNICAELFKNEASGSDFCPQILYKRYDESQI